MSPDQIADAARAAGARIDSWVTNPPQPGVYHMTQEQIEKFVELVVAHETTRAAIAKATGEGQ